MNEKKPIAAFPDYESKFLKFDALMQFRVKHILLVSSLYDSFILEEDGQLTDLIYNEYLELNLTITPHVKRASNAAQALSILETQNIDLVIIFKRVSDIDVVAFADKVKTKRPNMPVVLLAYHERELAMTQTEQFRKAIDRVFVWTGDVKILLAIIKLVEDDFNVDMDTRLVGVRVIILVEDSVKFYSAYLPMLYTEIMLQTRAVMSEGLNLTDKLLRMRARPKILLATNYEEAAELVEKYQRYLLALVSDFRFSIEGREDDEAGVKLVQKVRSQYPDIPVLMQSSDPKNNDVAEENDTGFLYKRSRTLYMDLQSFIMEHFGFGDFVFQMPDGSEIGRATDFRSMEQCLEWVDAESLMYHARRNHFSNWAMARTEFDLATRLRPRKVSEFEGVEAIRSHLIDSFRKFRHEKQLGVITDFSRAQFDLQSDFVRIGGGSIGGKGRGLAFINAILSKYQLEDQFDDARVAIPFSAIIGTDVFDDFLELNNLRQFALAPHSDAEIAQRFRDAYLPPAIVEDLRALLAVVDYPLAVRSSSMLEDSHLQPFAGVYETFMLSNNHSHIDIRLSQLELAIKLVYASTYFEGTRIFHEMSGNRLEDEKMAVIIQRAVGNSYKDIFYPHFSGVALSYNYYSLDGVKPEEGVVYVALGMGKTIVEGMECLRFTPSRPNQLPQMSTVDDTLDNAQHDFFAIDLSNPGAEPSFEGDKGLIKLPVSRAMEDGALDMLASTYSHQNHRIYDGTAREGTPVITFAPILKHKRFPLIPIVELLLKLGSQGMNCPVEIEFAVDLDDKPETQRGFYFLQIRPMAKETTTELVSLDDVDEERVILHSRQTLGNMRLEAIQDIVVVPPDTFDRGRTMVIAEQIGKINKKLVQQERPYLLIGPGRWGTQERWLGIPVKWDQIQGARVIVEVANDQMAVDPSFGTHFFANLTAFHVGYFTVNETIGNGAVDWDWFKKQRTETEEYYVKHIHLENPLDIRIDGRSGNGVVLG